MSVGQSNHNTYSYTLLLLSFLVADTRLYTLPCRSVDKLVGPSVTFLNSERFLHYCSCPNVGDWIAVYPALFIKELLQLNAVPDLLIAILFFSSISTILIFYLLFKKVLKKRNPSTSSSSARGDLFNQTVVLFFFHFHSHSPSTKILLKRNFGKHIEKRL